MTQEQAGALLASVTGTVTRHCDVVVIGKYRNAATRAISPEGDLACGTKPSKDATVTRLAADLADLTCRSCRAGLGLDGGTEDPARLVALVVLAITLGLRPGELRALRWDHLDLTAGIVHVWRSARRNGDTKTPRSRRTLKLPNRAVTALREHERLQDKERQEAADQWQEHGLVFCNQDGSPYSRWAVNWRFSKLTQEAGLGHWHAHEARHTAVSIMSRNGVPIQEIADTVGHRSTHVTETVYRHVIVPAIRGGATVMDEIFGAERINGAR
jgi:integrase